MFYKKSFFKKFCTTNKEITPVLESLFNNVGDSNTGVFLLILQNREGSEVYSEPC